MILLFSGTGNSLHVANQLAEHLGDSIVRLPVGDGTVTRPDNDRIIWVFPVYSWGVPPVVARWIRTLNIPCAEKMPHYAVMTCGDDTGRAAAMWRKEIEKRGWTSAGAYSVQMPNTYVLMKGFDVDSAELANRKIELSGARCEEIAKKIRDNRGRREDDVVKGSFPWIKTNIIYPWFVRFDMSPRPFHFEDSCIGCGRCAAICPMSNIEMVDRRPCWGKDCALCLGCYHVCPQHAVAYGKATRLKGQKAILTE